MITDSGTDDSHVTFVANEFDFSVETALNHVRRELQPLGWEDVTTWDDRPARRFAKSGSNLTVEVRPSRIGSEICLAEQVPATMGNRMRVWFQSLTGSD